RGFGMISEWAVMANDRGLILNWYGPSILRAALPSGVLVTLRQEENYPRSGRVRVVVEPERTQSFPLFLRVPYWSRKTEVQVNGQPVQKIEPGTYLEIDRKWKRGD